MKKKILAEFLVLSLVLTSCGLFPGQDAEDEGIETEESGDKDRDKKKDKDKDKEKEKDKDKDEEEEQDAVTLPDQSAGTFSAGEEIYYNPDLVPSVEPYEIAEDFSNVTYHPEFAHLFDPSAAEGYGYNDPSALRDALIKNGFAVVGDYGDSEFFDIYEDNRYIMFPSFISVDSLMHTYHLYFAYLLEDTEKGYLKDRLVELTGDMLAASASQYEELKGTDWQNTASENVCFFYVASMLLETGDEFPIDDDTVKGTAQEEYDKVMAAAGIDDCILTGLKEDYSQFKPRGYYAGDEELEKYFRAMMWYGRIPFALDNVSGVKNSILLTKAISENPGNFNDIYAVTSFFAGASDDVTYTQFSALVADAYGSASPDLKDIAKDYEALEKVMASVETLDPPQINSIPVMEGDDPVIPSFRFMGQRFTVDAAIMQKLIYSAVEENGNGEKRYLPDPLDVAAALGSDEAVKLLEEQGAMEYKNYQENLFFVSDHFNNADPEVWNASLYAGWLNTLRPLLEEKGEGYPSFMQSEEWVKKDMETFMGSYAELKHDTILYAKQNMAEMGDGEIEEKDDRGYVDPEPVVYSRFVSLANNTRDGLASRGMLTEQQEEDLNRLSEIAMTLLTISEKELTNEALTEDDYEFIRYYGGYIEHFWREVNDTEEFTVGYSYQAPCPIVADIATDPNGSVLEIGSGSAQTMYVVFPIDGELHVGRGSVYSFYQFTQPLGERLTDEEFRNMLSGGYIDEDTWTWVEVEGKPEQPQWTQSYRVYPW
jgi:hypothetical protein